MAYEPSSEEIDELMKQSEVKKSTPGTEEKPPEPEHTFSSMKADAFGMLSDAFKKSREYLSETVPKNLKGINEELSKNPLGEIKHAAGQIGVGLGESAKSLANLGLSALTPLSQLGGIPEGGHPFEYQIPEDTGLQNALGLQSNKKGDELLKQVPDIAALSTALAGLVKGGSKYLSKKVPIGPEKKRVNAATENIITSEKEAKEADKKVKALGEKLKEEYAQKHGGDIGELTASGQRTKIYLKEHKVKELEPTANIPEKPVPELPMAPDKEKMMAKVKEDKEAATKALSETLKIREEHPLKAGRIIDKHLNKLHDTASNLYNKIEKGYEGVEMPAPNTAKINETAKQLHTLIEEDLASGESLAPGYGSGTSEQKALEAKIQSLEKETVKASDVYDVLRTLQNRAKKARDASFKPGQDKIERTRLQKLAARHEAQAVKLGKMLEKVGDPNTKAMLTSANEGWRTWKDISRSQVGKSVARTGKIPSDTMFKITGEGKELKGNQHLRKLVESDTELSNYILGQKYSKPKAHAELLEGNETVDAYIKRSPEVQDKMTKLRVAMKKIAEGETNYKEARTAYKDVTTSVKEAVKEQKARVKSQTGIQKLTEEMESHKKAEVALHKEISQAEAKGENTAKLKEDLARSIREYNNKKTRLDSLKKYAFKYLGAKLGYETIVHKNNR